MLPPPCFTVPLQYLGFNRCPFGLRTRLMPSLKLNLDSSENSTVLHLWTWALANSSLAFLFFGDMKGRRLNNPASTALLRIALSLIFKSKRFRMRLDDAVGSFWIVLLIKESSCHEVSRGLPPE